MTFGDRLKAARTDKGFTQEQLAELIGVAKSTLTGYEKGNREPDFFKIKCLAENLGVSADYLLGTEKSPVPADLETEDKIQDRIKMLTDFFIESGFIKAGGDISDSDLKFSMSLINLIDSYFNK